MEFIVTDSLRCDGLTWHRVSLPRRISTENLDAIKKWCRLQLGQRAFGYNSYKWARWSISLDERSNLFFKHPEDVTLFLLKWA